VFTMDRDLGTLSPADFAAAIDDFPGADAPMLGSVVHVTPIDTPIGPMLGGATADHVVLLEFMDRRMLRTQLTRIAKALRCTFDASDSKPLVALRAQLAEYFAGARRDFDLPLHTPGSAFQRSVWQELLRIPAGETRSYGDVARSLGRIDAVRAVARANGDNRIAIIIPCHRVVGSDGKLVGYGGGLWRKRRLLELEGRYSLGGGLGE
jgi:AraC family transcriptional regulator of adaptative response/methylated-DNA-[protein]-cysteine methyltransferase